MRLELDWEEAVFRGLRALWRKVAGRPAAAFDQARAAQLEPLQNGLTLFAQVVAGQPLRVLPARSAGGVRGTDLLLPPWIDLAPDPEANRGLYLLRTALSAVVARQCETLEVPERYGPRLLVSLQQIAICLKILEEELPGFGPLYADACRLERARRPPLESLAGADRWIEQARQQALEGGAPWLEEAVVRGLEAVVEGKGGSPPVVLWGELVGAFSREEGAEAAEEAQARPPAGTERKAPPIEEIRRVLLSEKDQEASVLAHTFEKVETLDEYRGGGRDTDGADDLDAQLEALEEVNLGAVIRGGSDAESLLRADIRMEADIPDVADIRPDEVGLSYDEWDGKSRSYRKNWCQVYPTLIRGHDPDWAAAAALRNRALIQSLKRKLEAHREGLREVKRQVDGTDVDIDALVDELADTRAGHGGSPRLYVRQARQRREVATTILLDISLSTDAWVEDRRVLDVAREAVYVLGDVAHQLGDPLQILAFASHTRHRCRVWTLSDWHDSWSVARHRLGLLRPQGYTRIGPAIRHGTRMLMAQPASRRLLLLISDGKPTDYDRYEGRYGVEDVRQSLREASGAGIVPHALAIEKCARDYLPSMFGPGQWDILHHPDRLPEVLATVYGRMTGAGL